MFILNSIAMCNWRAFSKTIIKSIIKVNYFMTFLSIIFCELLNPSSLTLNVNNSGALYNKSEGKTYE